MARGLSSQHDDAQGTPVNIARACVYIDLAACQLERRAGEDVFSRWLAIAGQLHLIRGGLNPSIRAAAEPDGVDVSEHLDKALALLDPGERAQGREFRDWIVDLQALRAKIALGDEAR